MHGYDYSRDQISNGEEVVEKIGNTQVVGARELANVGADEGEREDPRENQVTNPATDALKIGRLYNCLQQFNTVFSW